jgi:hypothetical protein
MDQHVRTIAQDRAQLLSGNIPLIVKSLVWD